MGIDEGTEQEVLLSAHPTSKMEWRITSGVDYGKMVRWEPVGWRIERAFRHTNELDQRIPKAVAAWDGGHPQMRAPLSDPSAVEVRASAWYTWEYHEAHLRDFTMQASEALHHVRSALDYIAYQLVLADTGEAKEQTQFPIKGTPPQFRREATRRVAGISPEHLALIESVQPYNGVAWTGILNELSNRDKHRFPVDVVPCYQFETDSDLVLPDPLGQESYRGFQVEHAQMSFRFAETRGPDGTELEVTEALNEIVTGAARLVDTIFRESGTGSITLVTPPTGESAPAIASAFQRPDRLSLPKG